MSRGEGGASRAAVFLAVSAAPTALDLGLLVLLRQVLGWPLVVAGALSVGAASALSYGAHRLATFRSHPYARWVRRPASFLLVAAAAGAVDVVVLRLVFAAQGFTTLGGLLAAKAVALAVAAPVRGAGYRFILQDVIRENRQPAVRPLPEGEFRLSVVIPAYREVDRIAATIGRIRRELADLEVAGAVEIVVVDDGSGDGTDREALAAGADQVVTLVVNQGKGAAVRAGMLAARGRVRAFTDADLAYGPEHLRAVLEQVEAGWDVVIGNRRHPASTVARASWLRTLGSRIVNRLSAAVLLASVRDTQCGLKAFRGDVAASLFPRVHVDGFAFDIEVLHLAERDELAVGEVPVHLDEAGSRSTVSIGSDVARLVLDLVRMRRRATAGAYDSVSS